MISRTTSLVSSVRKRTSAPSRRVWRHRTPDIRRGRGSASLRGDVRAGAESPHIIANPNFRVTRRALQLEDSIRLNPHAREDLALTRGGLRCCNPARASEPGLVAASPGVGRRREDLRGDESAGPAR